MHLIPSGQTGNGRPSTPRLYSTPTTANPPDGPRKLTAHTTMTEKPISAVGAGTTDPCSRMFCTDAGSDRNRATGAGTRMKRKRVKTDRNRTWPTVSGLTWMQWRRHVFVCLVCSCTQSKTYGRALMVVDFWILPRGSRKRACMTDFWSSR